MAQHDTITGTVAQVIRHGHTMYGNPIMSVILNAEDPSSPTGRAFAELRISDNASLVYEIENPEFRRFDHTFVLTRAGRISHRLHKSK